MIELLNSNALYIPLKDKSVQCVVTSPPYYGLRDYGTAKWEGGDSRCDHHHYLGGHGEKSKMQIGSMGTQTYQYKNICGKCGAHRIDNQIGLEQSPEEYVANLVSVFREVWRVLRDDGTVWLNLGDSYATSQSGNKTWGNGVGTNKHYENGDIGLPKRYIPIGIKAKDLIGIPWRVALALQADGWYLRSDIIWHKPNPMPESVTDRPTKSHEYMFLLTKSAQYYYDHEAVKEPSKQPEDNRGERGNRKRFPTDKIAGIRGPGIYPMANKRTVWTIPTSPYKGAHFATFPPALVEPCIKAGSKEGDVILDPFAGSGTTLLVARNLGRSAIGLDLSYTYLHDQARKRLELDKLKLWIEG